jgi:prevent-host-death family protein
MATTGLRELRQQASELVRRAEAGETVTVTVSGRPVADLGPVARRSWRSWNEVAEVFDDHADADWVVDREVVDQALRDLFDQ